MPSLVRRVRACLAHARPIHGQGGQSLVEIAISLPVLLLIVLGLADFGRAFYYTSAIANAAREGAIYVSRQPSASAASVTQHACNETGFAAYNTACSGFAATVTCNVSPCSNASEVTVQVTYDLKLITAFMAQRILPAGADTIHLRAASKFPIVTQ